MDSQPTINDILNVISKYDEVLRNHPGVVVEEMELRHDNDYKMVWSREYE